MFSKRNDVQTQYGRIAESALKAKSQCCSSKDKTCSDDDCMTSIEQNYPGVDLSLLPSEAVSTSLGCANPLVFAEIKPGEIVLDLGSGGGIDVLLASSLVGQNGWVYGLDMTDEMLLLAHQNAEKMGVTNVEFIKGYIEDIPLRDNTVDVILSNCVINLSENKNKTISEAFRVLKPGGRLRVADVVATAEFDEQLKASSDLWCSCISGAILIEEYLEILNDNGFINAAVEVIHPYTITLSKSCCCSDEEDDCCDNENVLQGVFAGALIRADKAL